MRSVRLVWDEDTEAHIARHGIDPEEAEQACQYDPLVLRTRQGRYIILNQTAAGRYVTLIVASIGRGQMRLITARDMTEAERRRYRAR